MAYQPKSYRKFVATAATATLVATAFAPFASAHSFKDVETKYNEAVDYLVSKGVTGYTDGTFKTQKTITRLEAAEMLGKALGLTEVKDAPASGFTDVPARVATLINAFKAKGITTGKTATTFGANDNITRGELAIWIQKAYDLKAKEGSSNKFGDVADRYKAAVQALVDNEITQGTTETTFGTTANAKRGDYALFIKRAVDASTTDVASVKAINTTTVEVTYKEAVADVNATKYTIEGLTVSNAAVKQTDAKTVVLTTSAQEGNKEYTVKAGETTLGKFKGVSAVVPTAIKVTTPTVQGTIGNEVTVSAQVTVPEGQSKAGIPVTFNIVNDNSNLNPKVEVVAYTNEEGVASYSYTRYYRANDNVTAYATSKSSVFSSGKVYWAEGITITEVTEGNTFANGSKKVYKIKTDAYATQYVGSTSVVDYNYVNVAFAENVNVSPDKLVRGVEVIDTGLSTNAKYPSQVTTGGVNQVKVKVNAKGEATFTLTGSNDSVTPIVFVDSNKDGKLGTTELQAAASKVTFELNHTLGLDVKAEGVQNAAAINRNNANNKGTGEGGRDYTVTVTDKNGKVAPAGTVAYVTFEEGNYSTDSKAYILNADGNPVEIKKGTVQAIKVTGSKGQATFTLVGQHDAFAAPTVYLENGKVAGLDKADLQLVGETTFFVDAVINNATLTVKNVNGTAVSTLPSSQIAYFHYNSVDQNGFDYYAGTGNYEVSYQVTANFADVTVSGTFGSKLVKAGTTETVKVNASAGKAVLSVSSTNVASNVTVHASASQVSLPNQTASIEFTKGTQVPAVYTGNVLAIDPASNRLTFIGYDPITYSTSSFKNAAGIIIDETEFELQIQAALSAGKVVKVTAVRDAEGRYVVEIEDLDAATVANSVVKSAVLSADGLELTVTFNKNIDIDATTDLSLAKTDFTPSTGTISSLDEITSTQIKLSVTGISATNTLSIAADKIQFTEGSTNAAITGIVISQASHTSKLSAAKQTTASEKAVTQVLATATLTVGNNDLVFKGQTGEEQAAYNGIKVVVQQGSGAAPTAAYAPATRTITISLGYDDSNNDATTIEGLVQALGAHNAADFSKLDVDTSTTELTYNDVVTPRTTTITKGVTGVVSDVEGVYTFDLNTNLSVGDKVVIGTEVYLAGKNFLIGSTNEVTAANLAAAITANVNSRFDAAASSTNTVTLTETTATGLAKPTVTLQ